MDTEKPTMVELDESLRSCGENLDKELESIPGLKKLTSAIKSIQDQISKQDAVLHTISQTKSKRRR